MLRPGCRFARQRPDLISLFRFSRVLVWNPVLLAQGRIYAHLEGYVVPVRRVRHMTRIRHAHGSDLDLVGVELVRHGEAAAKRQRRKAAESPWSQGDPRAGPSG